MIDLGEFSMSYLVYKTFLIFTKAQNNRSTAIYREVLKNHKLISN